MNKDEMLEAARLYADEMLASPLSPRDALTQAYMAGIVKGARAIKACEQVYTMLEKMRHPK